MRKVKKVLFFVLLPLISTWPDRLLAEVDGLAFLVKFFNNRTEVIAPQIYREKVVVVMENYSNIKIYTQLRYQNATQSHQQLKARTISINIPAQDHRTLSLNVQKEDRLWLVPLAPGLPEVELKFGMARYEIPMEKRAI